MNLYDILKIKKIQNLSWSSSNPLNFKGTKFNGEVNFKNTTLNGEKFTSHINH